MASDIPHSTEYYCNAASVMPVPDSRALSLLLAIMRWSSKLAPQTATYLIGATLVSVTGGSPVHHLGRQWTRRLIVIISRFIITCPEDSTQVLELMPLPGIAQGLFLGPLVGVLLRERLAGPGSD
ncbi:hypothetical protein A7D00_3444 [Trichophyton violaceum]|uniref:Uncharacterized protein n=1 Tax=Trichophyton violaceum TaxID=34388 RepID=A0A178FK85_TRIVO|nr:hypothetical protein A7D00_3444 [Trichophyton violaceum]